MRCELFAHHAQRLFRYTQFRVLAFGAKKKPQFASVPGLNGSSEGSHDQVS
jgi:hypothetical protein